MIKVGDSYYESFCVDSPVYEGFAELFRDRNPLHTDARFAQDKGFKDRVMHGNILNGYLSYFIGECLPMKDVIIHSQKIRFHSPIYLHDRLDLYVTVESVHDSVNAISFKFSFKGKEQQILAKGTFQIGLI